MNREFKKHKVAYITLITGLLILTLLFLAAWPDKKLQRMIGYFVAGFYFIWGLTTHLRAEHINKKIVFEYLSISLLAAIILTLISW
jgi:hypothetical protein